MATNRTAWDERLTGHDRLRVIVNALTRLRFCSRQGAMEFAFKKGADSRRPRVTCPGSTCRVGARRMSPAGLRALVHAEAGCHATMCMALDGGCVWGGCHLQRGCWMRQRAPT
jgi:bis(5'-nucleosyl)-tetraphosphatase (symmetrical)